MLHSEGIVKTAEGISLHHVQVCVDGLCMRPAAGYVLLGILLGFFADCLTKILVEPYNFHNQHLVASNSNPGQNLTTDAAIVSIIQPRIGGRYWKTKVIYETCVAHFHACSPENREAIIGALDGSRSQFKAALNDVDWAVQTAPFQDSATNGVQIYSCQDEYSDVSAR